MTVRTVNATVARYYDPGTSQFLSRDPAEPLTRAPYAYAQDNPLAFADPSGLHWWDVAKKVTDVASLAVGAVATGLDAVGLPEVGVPLGEVSAGLGDVSAGIQCIGGGFNSECTKAVAFALLGNVTAGISQGVRAFEMGAYEGVSHLAEYVGLGGGIVGIFDDLNFFDGSCHVSRPYAPGPIVPPGSSGQRIF